MRAHSPSTRPGSFGFTLIEVLVAITLFALLSTALVSALRAGSRVTDRAVERVELTQDARVVAGFLRDALAAMVQMTTVRAGRREYHFAGESETLLFAAELPARFRVGGLWELALSTERRGDRSELVMARHLIHPDFAPGASLKVEPGTSQDVADHRVLLEDASAEFSYFGSPRRSRETPRWRDRWEAKWGIPRLVRIEVETLRDGAWPPIVVSPRVERRRKQNVSSPRTGEDTASDDAEQLCVPGDPRCQE